MVGRVRSSFMDGVEKVRWFSSVLNERVKAEVAVMKTMAEAERLDKKKTEAAARIGERVYELRGIEAFNALTDSHVREALAEMEKLDVELTELRKKASQMAEPGQ